MGFLVGLVLGFLFGLGLVMAFVYAENIRSRRRSELAATIAAFSKMTVGDSKKILPPGGYPPWVLFTQYQKLGWLNLHLTKIWPYVDEAASDLIRSSLEPVLEQYKSLILDSLKFSKLTLGTVAPQFTGISILENKGPDGITMELEVQWDGNPSIILDIQTKLGVSLPIQVKNVAFTGVFRLIFKPLVDEFPCFGAVSYSLRHKKKLDFTLKIVGGEVSSVPGISDAIEETINYAIEDLLTWPARKVIPIIPGDYGYLELKPVGTLEVKLVQARGLTNKDIVGKSDPYAVAYIRPLCDRMKKSRIINNDLNPVWNEHFEFIVEDPATQHLFVKIYDDEGIQKSELIGCVKVPLNDLIPGKVKDTWLSLVKDLEIRRDNKYRGEVHLELLYFPLKMEKGFSNPFAPKMFSMTSLEKALQPEVDENIDSGIDAGPRQRQRDIIIRGILSVTVLSAEDLPAMDVMGKADPFVMLQMKKAEMKNKTRVVTDNLNPAWNQTFDFVVEDGLHEMLILEIWDHDTFGKDYMGRCIMTLTRVILEGDFTDSFPLEGAKSGILNLHLKWTPQPIYRET
ncbi:synaptotagmin-5-like [Wolffia australiana]